MVDIIRTFTPDLEIRAAAQGGDGRTVVGIAVPYGRAQRIDPTLVEQFARGAFNHQLNAPHRVRFSREHLTFGGALIGRAVELRDDAAGLWGAWRVSATAAGDETLTLVEDGVLDELSVGFRERQNRRLSDGTIERVRADLVEVSVVLSGAYGRGALVEAVRTQVQEDVTTCSCGAPVPRLDEAREFVASLPVPPPLD
ncbi:MAG: HK97 family phage prohead protease [Pseudonocardia sp.]|nr:HK97 family phage prohead protease [Pseudonocardia sp.]